MGKAKNRAVACILALAALIVFPSRAASQVPHPLPAQVVEKAPGIHQLGRGRHSIWGIRVYDATLWVVGKNWSRNDPHALELDSGRDIPAAKLIEAALDEMRALKLGDASRLQNWSRELHEVVPNLKNHDHLVVFCTPKYSTLVFLDGKRTGKVADQTFCPAIMSIWLHPEASNPELRRALLQE